jgi:tetratricopeptide (TPR) repeat protein
VVSASLAPAVLAGDDPRTPRQLIHRITEARLLVRVLHQFRLACVPLLLASTLGAQHESHGARPRVGTVAFANTGAKAAQDPFLLGVAFLHSFEYDDAATAFRAAQKADPKLALAYWGEALTYSHIIWGTEDLRASRAALARLAPTPGERLAKAGNPRERAFGAAVEAITGEGSIADRTRAYADSMRSYALAAPNDVEAAAFASHAAMVGARFAPVSETVKRYEDATRFAELVVRVKPDHPGGVHYLIHATDSPRFAARGLAAARAYDKIAPDAEHALHMPSHIFLQLGLWDDVVASNERAWPASRAWVKRGGHSPAALSWHSLQWLQYGYLQQGRYRTARSVIDTTRTILRGYTAKSGEYPDVQHAIRVLSFQYASETGDWTGWPSDATTGVALARAAFATSVPRERSMNITGAYQSATGALHANGDTAAVVATARDLRSKLMSGTPVERLVLQLEAIAARARGNPDSAIALLQRAARIEAAMEDDAPVGPPFIIPTNELLGEMLLEARRSTDAVAAYERALAQAPNRSRALLGLARAKKAAGDAAGARDVYAKLVANWHRGDPEIPALNEARNR